jgi:hypothetical protein
MKQMTPLQAAKTETVSQDISDNTVTGYRTNKGF